MSQAALLEAAEGACDALYPYNLISTTGSKWDFVFEYLDPTADVRQWRYRGDRQSLQPQRGRVRQSIEVVGAELRLLPPCAPDLNPIALAFCKLKKAAPRRSGKDGGQAVETLRTNPRPVHRNQMPKLLLTLRLPPHLEWKRTNSGSPSSKTQESGFVRGVYGQVSYSRWLRPKPSSGQFATIRWP
jgi:hypothetical protein